MPARGRPPATRTSPSIDHQVLSRLPPSPLRRYQSPAAGAWLGLRLCTPTDRVGDLACRPPRRSNGAEELSPESISPGSTALRRSRRRSSPSSVLVPLMSLEAPGGRRGCRPGSNAANPATPTARGRRPSRRRPCRWPSAGPGRLGVDWFRRAAIQALDDPDRVIGCRRPAGSAAPGRVEPIRSPDRVGAIRSASSSMADSRAKLAGARGPPVRRPHGPSCWCDVERADLVGRQPGRCRPGTSRHRPPGPTLPPPLVAHDARALKRGQLALGRRRPAQVHDWTLASAPAHGYSLCSGEGQLHPARPTSRV